MVKINENEQSLFSKRDYEELVSLGLTEQEFDILQDAEVMTATAELLPDGKNLDKLAEKINKVLVGPDTAKRIEEFFGLSQKDPELFLQMVAFMQVTDMFKEAPAPTTQKISLADISAEKDAQASEESDKVFVEIFKEVASLSPAERAALKDKLAKK